MDTSSFGFFLVSICPTDNQNVGLKSIRQLDVFPRQIDFYRSINKNISKTLETLTTNDLTIQDK
jgi:hypothetical protein